MTGCQTESLSIEILLHSPIGSALHEDFKSALRNDGKFTVSSIINSQSPSLERRASSTKRTTFVLPGKQVGSSSQELLTPIKLTNLRVA